MNLQSDAIKQAPSRRNLQCARIGDSLFVMKTSVMLLSALVAVSMVAASGEPQNSRGDPAIKANGKA